MPTTTRKSGENHLVTFGETVLGTARQTVMELTVRTIDARASGDVGAVPKPLGLAGGQVQTSYLITDEATLALLGTTAVLALTDSGGTTVFSGECLCQSVRRRESYQDMTVVDASFLLNGLPTVPDLAGLS